MREELGYNKLRARVKNALQLRMDLVRHAQIFGVKPTAKAFNTSPQTVRLWLRRYQKTGLTGLKERSHKPQRPHPNTTPVAIEAEVVALRRAHPEYGQDRIAKILHAQGRPISGKTVGKILTRHQLIRPVLEKPHGSRDIDPARHARYPWEQLQVDVVDLAPTYETQNLDLLEPLPRYEYILRDILSGASFLAYGSTLEPHNIRCFIQRALTHLRTNGVEPHTLHVIDQGTWALNQLDQAVIGLLTQHGVMPSLLPPQAEGRAWSVAAFQHTLTSEFYQQHVSFASETDLLEKASSFSCYFNLERPDKRRKKTPFEIAQRKDPTLLPQAFLLTAIRLDTCNCSG